MHPSELGLAVQHRHEGGEVAIAGHDLEQLRLQGLGLFIGSIQGLELQAAAGDLIPQGFQLGASLHVVLQGQPLGQHNRGQQQEGQEASESDGQTQPETPQPEAGYLGATLLKIGHGIRPSDRSRLRRLAMPSEPSCCSKASCCSASRLAKGARISNARGPASGVGSGPLPDRGAA